MNIQGQVEEKMPKKEHKTKVILLLDINEEKLIIYHSSQELWDMFRRITSIYYCVEKRYRDKNKGNLKFIQ